jgi:hypothetical protein
VNKYGVMLADAARSEPADGKRERSGRSCRQQVADEILDVLDRRDALHGDGCWTFVSAMVNVRIRWTKRATYQAAHDLQESGLVEMSYRPRWAADPRARHPDRVSGRRLLCIRGSYA